MKNYISLLSNEDLGYICKKIGAKKLKNIYKKNKEAFNKLRPGVRPDKLSDEDTFSFAIDNKSEGFVAGYINAWINKHLEIVSNEKDKLIAEGNSEDIALEKALALSVFATVRQMNFTLLETAPEVQNRQRIDAAESKEKEQIYTTICAENKKKLEAMEQQIQSLQEKLDEQTRLTQEIEAIVLGKIKQSIPGTQLFIEEADYPAKSPDINNSYKESLLTIQVELESASVQDKALIGLSALLYAAYISRIPLLLAGPNAEDIVKAFSIGLNCKEPAKLNCEGPLSARAIQACLKSTAQVVIVEQPFQNGWQNSIIKLLNKRDKFYVLIHPFAEDLVIEPRGLFNYCLPVFTELFVEGLPSGDYIGGKLGQKYEKYDSKKAAKRYEKLFQSMKVMGLTKNNIQQLLTDMHECGVQDVASDYKLLLYPLAYVLDEKKHLAEQLEKNTQLKSDVKDLLLRLIGENE